MLSDLCGGCEITLGSWGLSASPDTVVTHTLGVWAVYYFFIFNFLTMPRGVQDPSSPTRDQTRDPAVEALSLNHWTTKEVP